MNTNSLSEQLLPLAVDVVQRTDVEQIIADPSFAGKLVGGMALALAAGIAADNAYEAVRHRGRKPTFTVYDAAHDAPDDVVTYYYSGFNSAPGPAAAVHRQAASQFGRFAVIHEGPSGYDAEALHAAVARQTAELGAKTVVTIGGSMGGTKSIPLETSLHLDDGLQVFSIKDCSPTSIDAIKGSRVKLLQVLAALDRIHMHGGPGFRTIAETVGFVLENKHAEQKYRKAFGHVLRKLTNSDLPTNRQCQTSATFMFAHCSTPYLQAAPEIGRAHISPEDPERDEVVDNTLSVSDFNQHARNAVNHITSPHTGHANPYDHPSEYRRMVTTAFTSFGLRTAEQRRGTVYVY